MTISSRTPEGDPNQCLVCGHYVRIEPSPGTRDAPCPRCGHLLWFSDDITSRHPDLAAKWSSAKEIMIEIATARFGPPPEDVRLALDRLDLDKFAKVELDRLVRVKSWDELVVLVQLGK